MRPHDEARVSEPWLVGRIDRLIPGSLHVEPESQLRSRVLVASSLGIAGLALAGLGVRLLTAPFDRGAVVAFAVIAIIASLPWVQRWSRSYRFAGGVFVAICMVAFPAFHVLLGIFPAPALVLFPLVPLLQTFFVGGRSGFAVAVVLSAVIVGLRLGLPPPGPGQLGELSWTFVALAAVVCMMVALVTLAYERARERSHRRLQAANIAFEEAHARAEAENRSKSEFLRHVSHELRTPLNSILGYGELVQEALTAEGSLDHAADIHRIRDASEQLLALINDLLDISRIEAGAIDLEFAEVVALQLLERVRDTIVPLIGVNHNSLELVVAPDLPPLITDEQRLRQVLLNLLSNACKFTEEGRILVTARAEGDGLVICVRDTGVGMTPDQCARLFEPFAQVHASLALRRKGTGLGLALSRRLVEQLGGTITVRSEVGRGSEFIVWLPLRRGPGGSAPPDLRADGAPTAPSRGP
jgi:signal transduction histidine kinase